MKARFGNLKLLGKPVVALALAFLISALCGRGAMAEELTVCHWLQGWDLYAVNEIIENFQKARPEFEVIGINPYEGGNFYNVVTSAPEEAASRCDVFLVLSYWTAELSRLEVIQPLDDKLQSPDDFFKPAIDAVTWEDHVWAAPTTPFISLLLVNRDLLKQLKIESIPGDWNGIMAAAKKFKGSQAGKGLMILDMVSFNDLAVRAGAKFFDAENARWTPNAKAIVSTLDQLRKLRFDDKVMPPCLSRDPFYAGDVALFLDNRYRLGDDVNLPEWAEVKVAPGPDGGGYFDLTALALSSRLGGEKLAAAVELVNMLSGVDADSRQTLIRAGFVPLRFSSLEDDAWREFTALYPYAANAVQKLQASTAFPNLPRAVEVVTHINRAVELALFGHKSAQQAMDSAYVLIKKIYEEDQCLESE